MLSDRAPPSLAKIAGARHAPTFVRNFDDCTYLTMLGPADNACELYSYLVRSPVIHVGLC
jgi:hypothetical protein